jgi:pyruvate dehydrogenase E2 component (dihydrolipoamide acetyltransferase)
MMKKFLAAVLLGLLVSPVFAADAAAPAVAAPAAADAAAAPADVAPAAEAAAPKAKKAKGGDEAGIKKTFKEFSEAWAAGDATAIAGHFLKEGSLINPFGQEAWGREDIEKVVAGDLAMMKGSTHTMDDYKFHFVLPGFVLVDATGTISGVKNADGSAAADMSVHVYAALAQRGAKWYILALRPYAFVKTGAMAAAPAAAAPAAAPPAAAPVAPAPAVNVPVPAAK